MPKPPIKWAGGKRSIMHALVDRLPPKINNYYEPFFGGGALFFEICDQLIGSSHVSDINAELINMYQVIRSNTIPLVELLEMHARLHSDTYYYKARSLQGAGSPVERAARLLYLLKTCYNGLYRVNGKGYFNTPIGHYQNPNICDIDNLSAVAASLKGVNIHCQDFMAINPMDGDFVYLDPPYYPVADHSFVKYAKSGFTEHDQIRLRDFALDISNRGVNVMISNSDIKFVRDLYERDFKITTVLAPRKISCRGGSRTKVNELLITNY